MWKRQLRAPINIPCSPLLCMFMPFLKTHLAAKWNVKFEGELHSQLQTCHHTILVSKNLSFHVWLIVLYPDCPSEKYDSFPGVLKAIWRAEGTARCPWITRAQSPKLHLWKKQWPLEDWNQENIKERMQNWDLPFQRVVFLPYTDNKNVSRIIHFCHQNGKLLQKSQAYISVI